MSINKTIAAICGARSPASNYRDVSTAADASLANTLPVNPPRNFLPGLRPVRDEVEVYFKDAFAGRAI